MAGIGGGGGQQQQYQQPTYQSSNPYAPNYKPPTGLQASQPAAPITPANGVKPAAPETDEEKRRRQALILGVANEGVGDGGDGSGGAASAGAAGDGGDGTGGGTGGTY